MQLYRYIVQLLNSVPFLFQNVAIIFFSAAKPTNERKISEASEGSATKEEIDSETDSAISDHDPESEDDVIDPNDLNCTEKDIEMFKQQLGDLDKAVCNTANKIDKIQEVLERVVENLRLGKPVEDYPPSEVQEEVKEEQVHNSHEIFDREKLLEVLKRQNVEEKKNPPRLSVGMIGYPNVGKSSTVNVLMQTKKVSIDGYVQAYLFGMINIKKVCVVYILV